MKIVNTCSCGKKYTLDEWRQLKKIGVNPMPDDGQLPRKLELRNCTCGSTRAIGLDENGDYCEEG